MPLDTPPAGALLELAVKWRRGVVYPGIPFCFVPAMLAGLVLGQFSGTLSYFPAGQPGWLELPLSVTATSETARRTASLILIPEGSDDFFLASEGEGIVSAWASVDKDNIVSNIESFKIDERGFTLDDPRGIRYPLLVVLEGSHRRSIDPGGAPSVGFRKLELATAESTWVVLFLLCGAVFGFGASAGFMKDGTVVLEEDAAVDEGHDKGK